MAGRDETLGSPRPPLAVHLRLPLKLSPLFPVSEFRFSVSLPFVFPFVFLFVSFRIYYHEFMNYSFKSTPETALRLGGLRSAAFDRGERPSSQLVWGRGSTPYKKLQYSTKCSTVQSLQFY
jgi:hypothetical protein